MARIFKNWRQAGSSWPVVVGFSLLVFLSATGLVVASPYWSQRVLAGVATASRKVVKAAYNPGAAVAGIGSVDGDYVQGLAKAVPGLVHR
jgi:hypothetical protein